MVGNQRVGRKVVNERGAEWVAFIPGFEVKVRTRTAAGAAAQANLVTRFD